MFASLLLLAAIAACAPGSALALAKPERKAMTVKVIDGASTATSAFVEITFKGHFAELFGSGKLRKGKVKVRFVPASGRPTTIIETGPAGDPERVRRGTKGFSDSVRSGRTFSVLVRGIKATAGKVVVTTRRGRKKVDKQKARLSTPVTEGELELELDDANAMFGESIDNKVDAVYARTARKEQIATLKEDLKKAKTRDEKRKLRKKLAKQKAKAAELRRIAKSEGAKVELIESWIKILEKTLKGPSARACNDGVDNGDTEDSIVDFKGFDPGCVMQLDNDEDDVAMALRCPTPGNTTSVTGTIRTPTTNRFDSFYVSFPPPAEGEPREGLIDAPVAGSRGGPYEVVWPKTLPCGPEIAMSYGYAVFSAGAPQGEYGLRVTLSASSPADNQNGGGQTLSTLRLAAGTSR